ncbi:MAG: glutamyl-tRNA reductase [Opitutales bacterium]
MVAPSPELNTQARPPRVSRPTGPAGRSVFVLGSSHRTASLEMREQLALSSGEIGDLYHRLKATPGLEEYLVLNTCNRVEIYGVAESSEARRQVRATLCRQHHLDTDTFIRHTFQCGNHEAIEHLFAVAAGIDSQMVGETEIFGQVKAAYSEAQAAGGTGPVLNRIFQKSFAVAKWARTHTDIGRGNTSVGAVAVELAQRIFGDLQGSDVLLLGSGDVGEKTAQALQSRGAPSITVASRRRQRAQDLAHRFGGAAIDFTDVGDQLHRFDIILTSTRSATPVLGEPQVRRALQRRPARPLFLIDLALPRDIDPAAADIGNVFLYNLDDLAAIANENLETRRAAVREVEAHFRQRAWDLWLAMIRRPGGLG